MHKFRIIYTFSDNHQIEVTTFRDNVISAIENGVKRYKFLSIGEGARFLKSMKVEFA